MSRRTPNPAADRAAQNQQTIKNLLKLEGNKSCADCKRNRHPRWASWNLGIFVCIRCSGIHRGMGTHISRVKSVDLDAWTDDQLQSVLRWGNTRANKYWEAKLAAGHVPSESKLENFIRTKYESKRWVMDGGMPDPSTLNDAADDDVPLGVVQAKQILERAASNRVSSTASQPVPPGRPTQNVDLFGDDPSPAPRPSTTEPAINRQPPPKPFAAPAKQTRPGDSLLGLDFFGPSNTAPASHPDRPTSVQSHGSTGPSRPDLKQSILSLYASAPKQQTPSQSQHSHQGSFSGAPLQSPPLQQSQSPNAFGGLNDAFSGLNFSPQTSPPASQQPKSAPFSSLGSISSAKASPAPTQVTSPPLSGGDFFSPAPKNARVTSPPSKQPQIHPAFTAPVDDFGAFGSAPSPPTTTTNKQSTSSNLDDLFSASPPTPPKPQVLPPGPTQSSVFNLSAPAPPSANKTSQPTTSSSNSTGGGVSSGWSNADAWGSNDIWGASENTSSKPAPSSSAHKSPPLASTSSHYNHNAAGGSDLGWASTNENASNGGFEGFSSNAGSGSVGDGFGGMADFGASPNPPKVAVDEDFGGWNSAAEPSPPAAAAPLPASTMGAKAPATSAQPKPATGGGGGFAGNDDLFSNVWE